MAIRIEPFTWTPITVPSTGAEIISLTGNKFRIADNQHGNNAVPSGQYGIFARNLVKAWVWTNVSQGDEIIISSNFSYSAVSVYSGEGGTVDLTPINDRLDSLEESVTEINESINTANTSIETQGTKITGLETSVDTLQGEVTDLTNSLSTTNTNLATQTTNLTNLTNKTNNAIYKGSNQVAGEVRLNSGNGQINWIAWSMIDIEMMRIGRQTNGNFHMVIRGGSNGQLGNHQLFIENFKGGVVCNTNFIVGSGKTLTVDGVNVVSKITELETKIAALTARLEAVENGNNP